MMKFRELSSFIMLWAVVRIEAVCHSFFHLTGLVGGTACCRCCVVPAGLVVVYVCEKSGV